MFSHKESIVVNYPIEQVYQLVCQVEEYPNYIPWCESAELLKVEGEDYYYRLIAKIGFFSKEFITKDNFYKNEKIVIKLVKGPFKSLNSIWNFKALSAKQTQIDFYIDFEFNSFALTRLLGKMFLEANTKILTAFLNQLDQKHRNI